MSIVDSQERQIRSPMSRWVLGRLRHFETTRERQTRYSWRVVASFPPPILDHGGEVMDNGGGGDRPEPNPGRCAQFHDRLDTHYLKP